MILLAVVAAATVGAGCSTNSGGAGAASSTSTTGAGGVGTTPTTASSVPAGPGDPVDAWLELWEGAGLLVSDPERAEELVTGVAAGEVYDQIVGLYGPGDSSAGHAFENYPVITDGTDTAVTVDDCVLVEPAAGHATVWYRGAVSVDEGRWRVESLEVVDPAGCVPVVISEAAIEGYEAYWDARLEFWDPADPDHPLVAETLAEPQLSLIRELLVEHEASGVVVRGRHISHPEIIEVRSAGEVVILDCQELDPAQGVFDASSGERLAGIPAAEEGDRGLRSAVMLLEEEGRWKVSDVKGRDLVDCEAATTAEPLAVVGPS